MSTFPWHVIDSGERFQDLVGCLLVQEVSKNVSVFGKAGRDYSIDASYNGAYLGETGSWRFQAKHYKNLPDLKKELRGSDGKDGKHTKGEVDRILAHLAAAPGEMGHRLWNGTTRYRLLTSLKLLPQERQEILDLLQPLVGKGIEVDVWDGIKIENLCAAHPFVMRQQFADDPPRFLPLAEFRRQQSRGPFGDFLNSIPYLGRTALARQFDEFMAGDQVVFFLHGPGGVGKTRAIIEQAARHDADPELSIHAVQLEGGSFDQRVPGEFDEKLRQLLIVDDADRCTFLNELLWLATKHARLGGRVRLLLASRSALAGTLRSAIARAVDARKVTEVALPSIGEYGREIATQLGHAGAEASALADVAEGIPLWLVLASEAVKNGIPLRDLTKERVIRSHIERYLAEVAPPERELHRRLLDLLAAIEPVNIKDEGARKTMAEHLRTDPPTLARAIDDVLRSGLAELRGRFLCIVPDILADYLLARALVTEAGIRTDFHKQLLAGHVPDVRRLVHNLARGEYLTGERLLDGVVAEVSSAVESADNAGRISMLTTFGVLAHVRPPEFLAMVELVLAKPQPDVQDPVRALFGDGTIAHKDVLDIIPPLLQPLVDVLDYRESTLELLARIAVAQDFTDGAGLGAMRVFQDSMQVVGAEPEEVAWRSLRVLERWWREHGRERLTLVAAGLQRLLAFESMSMEVDGLQMIMTKSRVVATPRVRSLRAAALELLRKLLDDPSKDIRLSAARTLAEACRAANRARNDDGSTSVVTSGGGQDGAEPIVSQARSIQKDADASYVDDQIRAFIFTVELRIATENSPIVLDALREVLRWHAEFAPTTPLGQRAQRIEQELLRLPAYRLFDVVAGTQRDPLDDSALARVVSEIAATNRPDHLWVELKGILREAQARALGGGGQLLTRVGIEEPDYGRRLFDLIDGQELNELSFYAGYLLAGLRVSGQAPELLADTARRPGAWRRVAAIACSRLRPAWYPGFSLDSNDLGVMRELLRDTDPSIQQVVASFLWLITDDVPDACVDLAEELATRDPAAHVQAVAEVCRVAIARDATRHAQARSIIDRFEAVADLSEPHVVALLARLAAVDLDWLFGFLERRIQRAARDATPRIRAVPEGLQRELPRRVAADVRHKAIKFVLDWATRSDRHAEELANLVRGLAAEEPLTTPGGQPPATVVTNEGEPATKPFLAALSSLLSAYPRAETIERIGRILRGFGDGHEKFDALAECVLATKNMQRHEQLRVRSAMIRAMGGRSMSWRPGETPPALDRQLTLLHHTGVLHASEPLVVEFVSEASTHVRREITAIREQDGEILIQ